MIFFFEIIETAKFLEIIRIKMKYQSNEGQIPSPLKN